MVKNNNINQTVYSFDLWGTLIKNKEKEEILKIIKSSDPNTELISGSKELLKQLYFQKNATLVTLSNSTLTSGSNTLSTLNLSNTIIGKNNS